LNKKRNNEYALHFKVKESIIQMIKKGEYKPHSQLPTEAEFCKTFGVSRTTVRTALQQLAVEGYVYKKQGKGTFVSDSKVTQVLTTTIYNFTDQLTNQGKRPNTKVLSLLVIESDEFLSELFSIHKGDPVNRLERIRYANDEPLQYMISYLPWRKTPGLNAKECEKSLYRLLESQFHLKIKKTNEILELSLADEDIAKKLEVKVGSPCFSLITYAYLSDGSLIEYSKTIFRGDKTNFVIEREY
jgi:GntR family transcriptional regulator